MAKNTTQDGGGWRFPAALEIIKCKEGNKEFIKERSNRGGGRLVLICEYHHSAVDEFGGDDARVVWRLAKRAARDFLRNSWIAAAVVKAVQKESAVRAAGDPAQYRVDPETGEIVEPESEATENA